VTSVAFTLTCDRVYEKGLHVSSHHHCFRSCQMTTAVHVRIGACSCRRTFWRHLCDERIL